MASRKIEDLHELMQPKAKEFLKRADEILGDHQAFITDGFRSNDEQTRLYAKGRTEPGNIVTQARAGQSPHNYGLAIDVAFRRDGTKEAKWIRSMYEKLSDLAVELGLTWGGTWRGWVDNPHFELRGWRNYINKKEDSVPKTNIETRVLDKETFEKIRDNSETLDMLTDALGIPRNSDMQAITNTWNQIKERIMHESVDKAINYKTKTLAEALGTTNAKDFDSLLVDVKGLVQQVNTVEVDNGSTTNEVPTTNNDSKPVKSKEWYNSKTNWLNTVMTVIGFAILVQTIAGQLPEYIVIIAFLIQGLGNLVLRNFFTDKPITQ